MSSPFSDAYKAESFETKILLKLDAGVNGTAVAEQIRGLDLEIYGVDSFDEQWQSSQQGTNLYTTQQSASSGYSTFRRNLRCPRCLSRHSVDKCCQLTRKNT